jgi:TolB-like protein/tetratricopeptide (TPR) repeat protein
MAMTTTQTSGQIQIGDATLDLDKATLSRAGMDLELRAKSFALLCYLARNRGQVLTKATLMDAVWPNLSVTENSLTQAIRDVRRVLGAEAGALLRTVARRGYVLDQGRSHGNTDAPTRPRIAVLPIGDPSGPAERRPLLDALSETIGFGLARFHALAVLARQSVFAAAADARGDPAQAGRRLNADFVVEGTAWPSATGLSVTLSLVGVDDGRVIWSEHYDLGTADILTLQDIVPRQIVQRLAISVEAEGYQRAITLPPERLSAFDHLARGLTHMRSYAIGSNEAARDYFARAITQDPNFGIAHSYWALADLAAHNFGLAEPEIKRRAREKAEHGLTLAPNDAVAWRLVAYLRAMTGDFAAAEVAAKRAVALNPSLAEALFEMAFVVLVRGRHTESLAWLARAEEIDPLFPPSYESLRSEALYLLGRYDEAAESLLRLPRLSVRQYVRLAGTYAQFGQRDAACDALRRAEALEPGWDHVGKMQTSYICENPADLDHMTEGVRKALAFRQA